MYENGRYRISPKKNYSKFTNSSFCRGDICDLSRHVSICLHLSPFVSICLQTCWRQMETTGDKWRHLITGDIATKKKSVYLLGFFLEKYSTSRFCTYSITLYCIFFKLSNLRRYTSYV